MEIKCIFFKSKISLYFLLQRDVLIIFLHFQKAIVILKILVQILILLLFCIIIIQPIFILFFVQILKLLKENLMIIFLHILHILFFKLHKFLILNMFCLVLQKEKIYVNIVLLKNWHILLMNYFVNGQFIVECNQKIWLKKLIWMNIE